MAGSRSAVILTAGRRGEATHRQCRAHCRHVGASDDAGQIATKFHIGLYLTLTASYITLATSKVGGKLPQLHPWLAAFAVVAFLIAGLAGGVIASSITQCECASAAEFLKRELGPWSTRVFTGLHWTYIEHTFFWIGIGLAVLSFKFSK